MSKIRFSLLLIIVFPFYMCEKDKEVHPEIETLEAESRSAAEIILKGNIIETGTFEILDYGFIIGSIPIYYDDFNFSSSESDNKISLGNSPVKGIFECSYTPQNIYTNTYQTYLTNSKGTVYGGQQTFEILPLHIYGMYPSTGHSGDTIKIIGENFGENAPAFSVKFQNIAGKILGVRPNEMEVIVPSLTYTYNTVYIYIGTNDYYCGEFRRIN
ncbi:MAG: IPT/TIG domain-containing protein [Bacteroidales bacterium]|nr:IPT/TIG domain-containing protein [Bacteroidales bacterium]